MGTMNPRFHSPYSQPPIGCGDARQIADYNQLATNQVGMDDLRRRRGLVSVRRHLVLLFRQLVALGVEAFGRGRYSLLDLIPLLYKLLDG